jgi:L-alanine-DL-glutamate epimerase-like enolase superfamily enzyme
MTRDELRRHPARRRRAQRGDAALWELESKRDGKPVWALPGSTSRNRCSPPSRWAPTIRRRWPKAPRRCDARALKIKLTGDLDLDIARVRAIRAARPDVWLGVDANQGFKVGDLDALVAAMVDCQYVADRTAAGARPRSRSRRVRSPIPIAADESA